MKNEPQQFSFTPTRDGGFNIKLVSRVGDFVIHLSKSALGHKCRIVDEKDNEVGTAEIDIDSNPTAESPAAVTSKPTAPESREEREAIRKRSWRERLQGAIGLIKSELEIDRAIDEAIAIRRKICKGCEHYDGFGVCGKCGCYLSAKITVASYNCPENKWPKQS